jgi:non-ribosomal peptide synthetase component F
MEASEQDLIDIWKWNGPVPRSADSTCVLRLIKEKVREQPGATAIDAWDGTLTYGELDDLSTQVANHLASCGVNPELESPVALCFEKSIWTPVAMLGVMYAGAFSVALDVQQPEERLSAVVGECKPKLMLCSATTRALANRLRRIAGILELSDQLLGSASTKCVHQLPNHLPPARTIFVTFTSGSTGRPKGACISHANVCAAVHHQGRRLGFGSHSRTLDFAPYSFDVRIVSGVKQAKGSG